MLKNKYITLITSIASLIVSIAAYLYLTSGSEIDFKREVYVVNLFDDNKVGKVNSRSSAIMTASTIATNLKSMVASIESLNLASTKNYLKQIEPMFDKAYFEIFSKDKMAEAEYLISRDVRVTNFVVTSAPVFVGVKFVGGEPVWVFYLEGSFMRDGLFTKRTDSSTFGNKVVWVGVKEYKSENGNPLGVKIVSYEVK